jgi:heme-degrading monooxygenase HmoA
MFVLVASAQVKPNAGRAFAHAFEAQVLPSLRGQRGFGDELLLAVPGGPEITAISFWDSGEDLDGYERSVWPTVEKALTHVIDRPVLRRFQLAHSTLHQEGAAAFPAQSPITTEPTGVGA